MGLTGGIASGKSTVADLMASQGALIIDADALAREVVAPGTPGLEDVAARFGADVITSDGSLDRAALGRVVFADEAARRDLEGIIHPRVRSRAQQLVDAAPSDAIVVQMIPLLVETGLAGAFDTLVVVDVPVEVQLERLMQRNGLSRDEAEQRVAAQASREQRLAVADHVIDNSGTPEHTARQVDALMRTVRSMAS